MSKERDERGLPRSASPVQSIDRAVELLDAIARSGAEGVSLKSLAESTELKSTTAHSLLVALVANGLVEQAFELGGNYRLGTRAFQLSAQYASSTDLVEVGGRVARRLRSELAETVFVSVLRNGMRVDLINLIGPKPLSINTAAYETQTGGGQDRLHASSVGKVLLAGMGDAGARAILEGHSLAEFTSQTQSSLSAVIAELEETARRGYATNREESDLGVCGVAAPVRDSSGRTVAAICVAYPSVRASSDYERQLIEAVADAARSYSRELGFAEALPSDR